QAAAEDVRACGHGRREVRVAHGDDGEPRRVREKDEIEIGRRLEKSAEIGRREGFVARGHGMLAAVVAGKPASSIIRFSRRRTTDSAQLSAGAIACNERYGVGRPSGPPAAARASAQGSTGRYPLGVTPSPRVRNSAPLGTRYVRIIDVTGFYS